MDTVIAESFATVRVAVVCLIGASKSIEHLPIREWRDIRPIKNARPFDRFCAALVSGNSLTGDGVFDGDYVIVRLTFELEEIKPGRLCAVLTPVGLLIKHIYLTLDNRIRLASANQTYEDLVFDIDDVEIQGVVVRVERDF
jgi:SOS-response transcriptional repressor LexA